jgi:hypothetical protein
MPSKEFKMIIKSRNQTKTNSITNTNPMSNNLKVVSRNNQVPIMKKKSPTASIESISHDSDNDMNSESEHMDSEDMDDNGSDSEQQDQDDDDDDDDDDESEDSNATNKMRTSKYTIPKRAHKQA